MLARRALLGIGLAGIPLLATCVDYNVHGGDPSEHEGSTPQDESCTTVQAAVAASDLDAACQVVPGTRPAPAVLWSWVENDIMPGYHNVMMPPIAIPLTDDNSDGRIDRSDLSDIVFVAYENQTTQYKDAVVAVSGRDGRTLWSTDFSTLPDEPGPIYNSPIAAGVLSTGDGVSIIVQSHSPQLVVALDPHGEIRWWTDLTQLSGHNATIRLADMDGDLRAEILQGTAVLDDVGALIGPTDDRSYDGDGPNQQFDVADLDGDGLAELIFCHAWYAFTPGDPATVTLSWLSSTRGGLGVAAGDFIGDGQTEVICKQHGSNEELDVHARAADSSLLWSGAPMVTGDGGGATVADVNGDGVPEWIQAGADELIAYQGDGTVLWRLPIQDTSSAEAAAAAYDFNADGAMDLAYADETNFHLIDGRTGQVLFTDPDHSNLTWSEHPIIVDLDGDASVEIVVANTPIDGQGRAGIVTYTNPDGDWYSDASEWPWTSIRPGELDDDLRPRPAATVYDESSDLMRGVRRTDRSHDLALVEASLCTDDCDEGVLVLSFSVENRGVQTLPMPTTVTVHGQTSGASLAQWQSPQPLDGGTRYGPVALRLDVSALAGEETLVVRAGNIPFRVDCNADNQEAVLTIPSCEP